MKFTPNDLGRHPLAEAFKDTLVNLGDAEDLAFDGILSPEPEVGRTREGASATFLEDAEVYYTRHQSFDYWKYYLKRALDHIGIVDARLIVEYGCGFGNSTLPLLDIFHDAQVIATDISPNLLAILRRLIDARGLGDRCLVVAMDAQKPYIKGNIADLVVGSAVLHHLSEPGRLIQSAMHVLKPHGAAIFFEPLEAGYALVRVIIRHLCREAAIREEGSPALTWLAEMAAELNLQIQRDRLPGWRDLDDKWLFPRSVLQEFADAAGAELIITSINESNMPFRLRISHMLKMGGFDALDAQLIPGWAWDIIDQYENDFFSAGLKRDLMDEGCVIFRKRS